jgi:hypothetical protein
MGKKAERVYNVLDFIGRAGVSRKVAEGHRDTAEISRAIGKEAMEQLGVSADSAYVTHHDVLRAAELGARLALESSERNITFVEGGV